MCALSRTFEILGNVKGKVTITALGVMTGLTNNEIEQLITSTSNMTGYRILGKFIIKGGTN